MSWGFTSHPSRGGLPAVLAALFLLSFTACAPTRSGNSPGGVSARPGDERISFLLVYMIHGDGDYIYHDAQGLRRLADEDALAQAREVAMNAPEAEVFIFHQKPRWHIWSHPSRDGTMFQYRRGTLVREQDYSRRGKGSDFAAEAGLFRKNALPRHLPPKSCLAKDGSAKGDTNRGPDRFFVYFGHEIPALGGRGYSHSRPKEEFSLPDFARGVERFAGPPCAPNHPLSVLALSSCYGGTPATTATLFPFADFLLASPTPLHLSFLDTRALIPLMREESAGPGPGPAEVEPDGWRAGLVRARVEQMAQESFTRLQGRTQTAISIALYESERASDYLMAHSGPWDADGELGDEVRMAPMGYQDCGEDAGFGPGGEEAGVQVYYQAAKFGALRSKSAHSGWSCPSSSSRAASAHPAEAAGSLTAPPSVEGRLGELPVDSEDVDWDPVMRP